MAFVKRNQDQDNDKLQLADLLSFIRLEIDDMYNQKISVIQRLYSLLYDPETDITMRSLCETSFAYLRAGGEDGRATILQTIYYNSDDEDDEDDKDNERKQDSDKKIGVKAILEENMKIDEEQQKNIEVIKDALIVNYLLKIMDLQCTAEPREGCEYCGGGFIYKVQKKKKIPTTFTIRCQCTRLENQALPDFYRIDNVFDKFAAPRTLQKGNILDVIITLQRILVKYKTKTRTQRSSGIDVKKIQKILYESLQKEYAKL